MERIIITTSEEKQNLLKEYSKNKCLLNQKFYTFLELKKKLYFDYDLKTIFYIVSVYHVSVSIAKIYLENMYFLRDLDDEKVKFLNQLKDELDKSNLLIYSKEFKKSLENKEIVVYGYSFFTKEEEKILNELGSFKIEHKIEKEYEPQIYEAEDKKSEVAFVLQKIGNLLESGVLLNQIKIIANSDYDDILNRSFFLMNISFHSQKKHSFYGTLIAQEFLSCYDEVSIEENILALSEKYSNVNDFIEILNRSALIADKNFRKEFIIDDLKNALIKEEEYTQKIESVTYYDSFGEEDYVFLLGFNMNDYPRIHRDTSYLSDDVKRKLGLDTADELNQYEKKVLLKRLKSIRNLVITYKLYDTKTCYPSLLVSELSLNVKPVEINNQVSYSKIWSQIEYARDLDQLYKYNIVSKRLPLYQNNLIIPYASYQNQFSGISTELFKKKLNHELVLSYTNLEIYQECAFRYYVSKILHLDIFEENFKTILGSIMHHILELGVEKEIDIPVEMMKFIKDKAYVLSAKEMFYLEMFSEELKQVLRVIRKQAMSSKLKQYLFEQEFYVYKDTDDMKLTFKGTIDKVMYHTSSNNEVLAIVDYKSGNTNITLKNLEYGLHIQLPIYLYLIKKSERFSHASVAGFYIQKVAFPKEDIQFKKSEEQIFESNLRLQGYTNQDLSLIKYVDNNYQEGKIIQNLKIKKDGEISANSKVLDNEQMDALVDKVDTIIDEVFKHILNHEFLVNPKVIDGKNISCTYCKFRDLCFKRKENEVVLGGESDELDDKTEGSN